MQQITAAVKVVEPLLLALAYIYLQIVVHFLCLHHNNLTIFIMVILPIILGKFFFLTIKFSFKLF